MNYFWNVSEQTNAVCTEVDQLCQDNLPRALLSLLILVVALHSDLEHHLIQSISLC